MSIETETRPVPPTDSRPVVSTWTITKGVFFGMWLFAISAAVISFVVSALFLGVLMQSFGGGDEAPRLSDLGEQIEGSEEGVEGFTDRDECMADPNTTAEECNDLFGP